MINVLPIEPEVIQVISKKALRESFRMHRIEEPSKWQGEAAKVLRLRSPVKPEQLAHLLNGFTPDGWVKLRDGQSDKQCGWGIEFVSPSTFNTLWALSPGGARTVMQKIQRDAASQALDGILADLSNPGATIAAVLFRQARNDGRPNVAVGAVLPDLNVCPDQPSQRADHVLLFPALGKAEKVYTDLVCEGLKHHLGLPIQRGERGFEISGVPEKAFDKFDGKFPSNQDGIIADLVRKPDLFAAWKDFGKRERWGEKEAAHLLSFYRSMRSFAKSHQSKEKSKTQEQTQKKTQKKTTSHSY